MSTTRPAPVFESALFIPPASRLSQLALAAIENGISADDIKAYMSARPSAQYRMAQVTIELLNSSTEAA